MNIVVTYTLSEKDTASEFRDFWKLHRGTSFCYNGSWGVVIDGDTFWFVSDHAYPRWIEGRTYVFLDDLRLFHSGVPISTTSVMKAQ